MIIFIGWLLLLLLTLVYLYCFLEIIVAYWLINVFEIYLFLLFSKVSKHQKPSKLSQHWIRHTCGVVGLSFCSLWLLQHSRLMGSPDIDNWIREAKDSTISFFNDHVEQPVCPNLPFSLLFLLLGWLALNAFSFWIFNKYNYTCRP